MKRFVYLLSLLALSTPAFAQDAAGLSEKSVYYIAAMLGVALAAVAGTMSQSKAASVALEGIARNPAAAEKLFTPMILAMALMESLVIFTWVSIFIIK